MSPLKFKSYSSSRIQRTLEKASKLAEDSLCSYRHAAIIVKNGTIVATGINKKVNPPTMVEHPKLQAAIHAEIAALSACRKTDLNGASIFIARITRSGDQAMSKPCLNCQKALRERGVKKVYYTIDSEMDLQDSRTNPERDLARSSHYA